MVFGVETIAELEAVTGVKVTEAVAILDRIALIINKDFIKPSIRTTVRMHDKILQDSRIIVAITIMLIMAETAKIIQKTECSSNCKIRGS
jgi:hypothetical protein